MPFEMRVRLMDGPGGRARGQIMAIKELPHPGWGSSEGLPLCAIVKISDEQYKNIAHLAERHYTEFGVTIGLEPPEITKELRSRYTLDIDVLPALTKTVLETTQGAELSWSELSGKFVDATSETRVVLGPE